MVNMFGSLVTKYGVFVSDDFGAGESGMKNDVSIPLGSSGANVVVLSQPEEIVTMATGLHSQQETSEEIVYDNTLLHTEFDHEEIASNMSVSSHDLDPGHENHNPDDLDSGHSRMTSGHETHVDNNRVIMHCVLDSWVSLVSAEETGAKITRCTRSAYQVLPVEKFAVN